MSPRSRRIGVREGPSPPWFVVIVAMIGAVAGFGAAPWLSTHTSGRTPVDERRYQLVVPGAASTGQNPADAARSGLADGNLHLASRDFDAPERLVPQVESVGWVDLEIRSGEVVLTVQTEELVVELGTFGADAWTDASGKTHPHATPGHAVVTFREGLAWVDGVTAATVAPGRIELAPDGDAVLAHLLLADPQGRTLLEDDFRVVTGGGARLAWAALCAVYAGGIAAALAASRGLGARATIAVAALLPFAVLALPYADWITLARTLYLGGVDIGDLRRLALAVSTFPVATIALLASGALRIAPDERTGPAREAVDRQEAPITGIVWALAALVAARDAHGIGWLVVPLGSWVLLLFVVNAHHLGQSKRAALIRDLPALGATAALGFGSGLLPAVLWRLVTLAADARVFLDRAPRKGADTLLFLLLLLPVSAELFVRGTALDDSWNAAVLSGASASSGSFDTPFWSDVCSAAVEAPKNVLAFGGSSTGGAWQFAGDPSAFFPARLHTRLCAAALPVRSLNYGDGGRDTFDIARAAPGVFATWRPDVVLLYVGVNDVLTRESHWTRAQQAERAAATSGLSRIAGHSRLLTGLALLFRPREPTALVQAVPLADAEANIRSIATLVAAAQGRLLLVPELTRGRRDPGLAAYDELLARLGEELPGTDTVDLRSALGPELDGYLSDRNHLTPEGGEAVAAALEPAVRSALEGTAAPEGAGPG